MFKKRDITTEAWKWKRRPKFCTHQLIKNGEYFRVGSNGSADVFCYDFYADKWYWVYSIHSNDDLSNPEMFIKLRERTWLDALVRWFT